MFKLQQNTHIHTHTRSRRKPQNKYRLIRCTVYGGWGWTFIHSVEDDSKWQHAWCGMGDVHIRRAIDRGNVHILLWFMWSKIANDWTEKVEWMMYNTYKTYIKQHIWYMTWLNGALRISQHKYIDTNIMTHIEKQLNCVFVRIWMVHVHTTNFKQ